MTNEWTCGVAWRHESEAPKTSTAVASHYCATWYIFKCWMTVDSEGQIQNAISRSAVAVNCVCFTVWHLCWKLYSKVSKFQQPANGMWPIYFTCHYTFLHAFGEWRVPVLRGIWWLITKELCQMLNPCSCSLDMNQKCQPHIGAEWKTKFSNVNMIIWEPSSG